MVVPRYVVDAVRSDDLSVFRRWFEAVPDRSPEEHDDSWTRRSLLGIAAGMHAVKCARFVIGRGANVNSSNPTYMFTPLHIAVDSVGDRREILTVLVEAGADVNARNYAGNTPLATLLFGPRYEEKIEHVKVLLRAGASLNCGGRYARSAEDVLEARHVQLNEEIQSDCLDLIRGVRAAGGWTPYVLAPHRQILALRSLRARGRAAPGPATPLHVANLTQPSLPNGVVWIVLSYWRETR